MLVEDHYCFYKKVYLWLFLHLTQRIVIISVEGPIMVPWTEGWLLLPSFFLTLE